MSTFERAVQDIEEGNAWDENAEVVQVDVRKPLDTVVPVRLTSESWEQLRQEARRLGIGPSTLARIWILERLRMASMPWAALFGVSDVLGAAIGRQVEAAVEERLVATTPKSTQRPTRRRTP